jgi:hypothetical protein
MNGMNNKYSNGMAVVFSPSASIADSSATHSRGLSWNFGRRLYENAGQFFNGSWARKSGVARLYPRLLDDLNEAESLHCKRQISDLQVKLEKIDQTIGKIFPKSVFWSHLKEMGQFLLSRKYQSAFEAASTIVEKFKHIACYRAVRYLHTKHMNPYGMGTRTDFDVTVRTPRLIPLAIEESTDSFRKKVGDWFSQNADVAFIGGTALSVGFLFTHRKILLLTTGALGVAAYTAYTLYQWLGDGPRQEELNRSAPLPFNLGSGSIPD